MPRRFLIALLAFGAIAGYASGFASIARRHHWRHHHAEWEYSCGDHRHGRWTRPSRPSTDAPPPGTTDTAPAAQSVP